MNKFQIGDLVRGTKNSPYSITDEAMTLGEVIKVYKEDEPRKDDICVKVLEHRRRDLIGEDFVVDSRYFEPAHAPKIILSPDNTEDTECLMCKASRIVKRLSEKSGVPIDRLTSLIVIGAEKFVEIENVTGKEKEK